MNILEFYLEQQKYPEWYKKFQSMAKDKSGKIFSYSSTTYRYMHNFIADVEKFYRLNGVPMDQWPTYEDGQKEDKQRTLPLSLANFVFRKEDRYFFTGAGYTCMDIINLEKTDNEEWLLLFLLLLDYRSEWRNNDIILTSKEYIKYLLNCGISENDILDQLRLGHSFKTDVARLTIPSLGSVDAKSYSVALSFMYAFLEGISDALEIDRDDIDGIIEMNAEEHSWDVLVYDNVPGGAGHVKRLLDKTTVIDSLKSSLVKVSQNCCDEDTSCYNCLRNYYNQMYHRPCNTTNS